MPYKSDAQRRWAHTSSGLKALGGKAAVHEWDEASKGKKLPEKVKGGNTDLSTNSLKGHELSTSRADNLAAKKAFTTRPRAKGNKRY